MGMVTLLTLNEIVLYVFQLSIVLLI